MDRGVVVVVMDCCGHWDKSVLCYSCVMGVGGGDVEWCGFVLVLCSCC